MAEMHASKDQLPAEKLGDYEVRKARFGDYYASFLSIPAGMGLELFKGLPDDACQSEHWGYVFNGSYRIRYTDGHEEVVSAGEAYYCPPGPPGHVFAAIEDCETIEFSPKEELDRTLEVVGKNLEAMGEA